jgi:hypothetical protein
VPHAVPPCLPDTPRLALEILVPSRRPGTDEKGRHVQRLIVLWAVFVVHPGARGAVASGRAWTGLSNIVTCGPRGGTSYGLSAYTPTAQIGYRACMKRERDELDSLAAEAGQSVVLVGMTALVLVIALVLGFAV